MVVLAGIALIVVGPEKLPGLARKVGRFVNDLKRTTNTIASDITNAVDEENFLNSDKANSNQNKEEHLEASSDVEEGPLENLANHNESPEDEHVDS